MGCLASCEKTPSEEESAEILAEFAALYEKSLIINEYVFGEGLPVVDPESDPDKVLPPHYHEVSEDAPYRTFEEFKAAILEVYSEAYYTDSLNDMLFSGYGDDKKNHPRYKIENGTLRSNCTHDAFDVSGRFDVSSAVIVKLTAGFCQIEADYTRGTLSNRYTITMAKTADGWRFDAPSF